MKGELRHVWPVEQIEAHAERLLEQLIVPHPDEELVGYVPVQVGEDER